MPFDGLKDRIDSTALVDSPTGFLVGAPPIARSKRERAKEEARRVMRDRAIRAVNVLMSSALILFFLPLMAVIALAVRLTSAGPVVYAQERVGFNARRERRRAGIFRFGVDRRARDLGGRIFKIYKFRTMFVECSKAPQVWASKEDPRVTKVGRFLRAHRLDEIPQLLNVLKGDMNLVGPRPEQPDIFEELRKSIPVYQERQSVKPGITGWAQVNHHYDSSLDDVRRKLHLDLEYVRRRSVAEDVKIMAKTPSVMIFKQGSH